MNSITIIIPIYKTPIALLLRCFKSLLDQTSKNFEIIIVINGKNDLEEDIKLFFKDVENARIIFLNENVGFCYARQIAINSCSTQYIGFLDSDDELDTNYIENFHKNCSEMFDLVFIKFDYIRNEESETTSKQSKICKINRVGFDKFFWYSAAWAKIISRNFLLENQLQFFYDKTNIIEDLYFHICLLYKFKTALYIGDHVMYKYHQNNMSVSHVLHKKEKLDTILCENWSQFFTKFGTSWRIRLFVLKYFHFSNQGPRDLLKILKLSGMNLIMVYLISCLYTPFFIIIRLWMKRKK